MDQGDNLGITHETQGGQTCGKESTGYFQLYVLSSVIDEGDASAA